MSYENKARKERLAKEKKRINERKKEICQTWPEIKIKCKDQEKTVETKHFIHAEEIYQRLEDCDELQTLPFLDIQSSTLDFIQEWEKLHENNNLVEKKQTFKIDENTQARNLFHVEEIELLDKVLKGKIIEVLHDCDVLNHRSLDQVSKFIAHLIAVKPKEEIISLLQLDGSQTSPETFRTTTKILM